MISDYIGRTLAGIQQKVGSSLAGPLEEYLTPDRFAVAWEECGHRFRYSALSPWVTFWAFLGQTIGADQCCRKALARINAHRFSNGLPLLANDTSSYCKARKRLPERLFEVLFRNTGAELYRRPMTSDHWKNRNVKLVDGSSSSMPDTEFNQEAYTQPKHQKPGCGFPVIAYVAVFCLATGAVLDIAFGTWNLHDLNLFCLLRDAFSSGDICLADRGFCTYAEIALLRKREVDIVMRLHQRRKTDFRLGRIVGLKDHIVSWSKPSIPSRYLSPEEFKLLPESMLMRELKYNVAINGFRTHSVVIATTLLDAILYSKEEVAELYFHRWDVELDFAHLKTTMQMDILRTKTPEMVRKEIYAHLIAYNIIRHIIYDAAQEHHLSTRRLSLKGTIQQIEASREMQCQNGSANGILLTLIAEDVVPYRPGRLEPRVRKRRPKNYRLMMKPRSVLKAKLMAA